MKISLIPILLFLLHSSVMAQTDPCLTCPQLDTAALTKEQYQNYKTLCFKRDSIALPNDLYQITMHHRCKTYKEVTQYNLKAEKILGYIVEENDTLFTYTDHLPEFPGGRSERNKFLVKNVIYPRDAEKKKIEGKVMVSFYIDENGKVYKLKLKEKIYPSLDKETLRVFALAPDFTPGTYQGVRKKFLLDLFLIYRLPE